MCQRTPFSAIIYTPRRLLRGPIDCLERSQANALRIKLHQIPGSVRANDARAGAIAPACEKNPMELREVGRQRVVGHLIHVVVNYPRVLDSGGRAKLRRGGLAENALGYEPIEFRSRPRRTGAGALQLKQDRVAPIERNLRRS